MARELGQLSEYQAALFLLENRDLTIAFDATMQGGRHFNAILVTNEEDAVVLAIDELPGGTALDYSSHILSTLERLAKCYSCVTGADEETTLQKFVLAITNTMSDRCATNHAAIQILRQRWGKTIQELFCHVHPLDSFASKVRASLKKSEPSGVPHGVYGFDCVAANIILALNKMRYKMAWWFPGVPEEEWPATLPHPKISRKQAPHLVPDKWDHHRVSQSPHRIPEQWN